MKETERRETRETRNSAKGCLGLISLGIAGLCHLFIFTCNGLDMKITANFATYPPREEALKKAVASIIDQVDEVRIHFNGYDLFEVPLYFQKHGEGVFHLWRRPTLTIQKFLPLGADSYNIKNEYYFSL